MSLFNSSTALFVLVSLVIIFVGVVAPVLCLCKNWKRCPMAKNKDKERCLISGNAGSGAFLAMMSLEIDA